MTKDPRVGAMRSLCHDIETAIARGDLPAGSAGDLKAAIDETRMRVWASLEAAKTGDPSWVQEFWLHRAADVCHKLVAELQDGAIDPNSAKARELRSAAERLAAALAS